jgi:virulence-associated protein VagC
MRQGPVAWTGLYPIKSNWPRQTRILPRVLTPLLLRSQSVPGPIPDLGERSQAVRLPKEFRPPSTEVRVRPVGGGSLFKPSDAALDAPLLRLPKTRKTAKIRAGSEFISEKESRLCSSSLLELLSSPSQFLRRRFRVQLRYPRNQSCCAAQKA